MTTIRNRLLVLNIGTPLGSPSHLLSISPADAGDVQTLVADLGVAPDGIAIDPVNRHIFWTYMGTAHQGEDFLADDGRIERVNFDGSGRIVVVPEGRTTTPKQMQCDARAGLIYWCDREGMRVMRARTDGSGITVLVQTGSTPEHREDRRRHCVGIAVDPRGGFLYWTQKGKPNGNEGRIFRAALDLPPGMDPAHRADAELLFDNLPEPIDLEWDEHSGCLYWTDRGDPPDGNTLNRADLRSGKPWTREVVLSGLKEAIGLALDRSNKRAFVADLGGFVHEVALDRPGTGKVVFSGHGPITGIAYQEG